MISLVKLLGEESRKEIEQPYRKGKIAYVPRQNYKAGDTFIWSHISPTGTRIDKQSKIVHALRTSHLGPYVLTVKDEWLGTELEPYTDPKTKRVEYRPVKVLRKERELRNIHTSLV